MWQVTKCHVVFYLSCPWDRKDIRKWKESRKSKTKIQGENRVGMLLKLTVEFEI